MQLVTKVSDINIGGPIETQFAQDHATTTGLTFGYKQGFYVEATTLTDVPAGTVTLTDDALNLVLINTIDPAAAFVGAAVIDPLVNCVLLFHVVTASGVITSVTDYRARRTAVI